MTQKIDFEEEIKALDSPQVKRQRTPKNAESITKGALALSLEDKVALADKLADSIEQEVQLLQLQLNNAKKISGK